MQSKEFENRLKRAMAPGPGPGADPLLVFEARMAVQRKAQKRAGSFFAKGRLLPLLTHFRLQQAGFACMLLLSLAMIFRERAAWQEAGISTNETHLFSAASNTSLSVISSTMLTSIPTLRN